MEKEQKNLLVFGYGLGIILSVIGLRLWIKYGLGIFQGVLLTLAGLLIVTAAVHVQWLRPLYTLWMKVAGMIGRIISTVLLGVIFYLVFGLAGTVLRLLRKDLLDLPIERQKETYWHDRPDQPLSGDSYLRQF